ncbi:rhomboid family intramembrane serine protease [Streptomyces pacificus]|uniref:Rhomboid family intramembrane serine protease n=1 Tax=Streptomyces pacificus TaxID=2705029 RepID=A0A6A0AV37_9ACTN|nr:rhomboid family intramembrane serine protease [Streptomyces pacificus]GFH36538.1 rhomboid family intramembrane serine protease [Streptomyces pacificus]
MDQVPGSPDRPRAAHGLPGCYRHPGRETGIRCTRCERPICPECMVSASVGFQCPECVRTGSGTGHAPSASRPRTIAGAEVTRGDPRLVTKILLALNAAVFLAVLASPALAAQLILIGRAFDPQLQELVGVAYGEWYRLLTSVFLHQQIWHIAFNMLGLWWLGGPLEAALGRVRYLALYLLSGLAGSALVYLLAAPNQGVLGASGAVWGLLGATAVLLRRLDYDLRPVIALLALNLLFTFTMPGISWESHVGGLVGGTVIAFGMVHAPRERRTLVQAGVCALILLVSVVAIVLRTQSLPT